MEVSIDFESVTNQINITYLNNLIKVCEKHNINKDELYKRIDQLQKKKEEQISETKLAIKKNISLNNLSTIESPKYNDDYLYQKPWTKLTPIHKIIKIKEFVNQLLINDEEAAILKEKLVELVKNKILTKKEAVTYDSVKRKVISITHLQYKNGKYDIEYKNDKNDI